MAPLLNGSKRCWHGGSYCKAPSGARGAHACQGGVHGGSRNGHGARRADGGGRVAAVLGLLLWSRDTPRTLGASEGHRGAQRRPRLVERVCSRCSSSFGRRASMGNAHVRVLKPPGWPRSSMLLRRAASCPSGLWSFFDRGRGGRELIGVHTGAMAHALMQRAEDGPSGAASGPMLPTPQLAFRWSAFTWRDTGIPFILTSGLPRRRKAFCFGPTLWARCARSWSITRRAGSRHLPGSWVSRARACCVGPVRCWRWSSSCSRLHWRRPGLISLYRVLCDSWQLRDPHWIEVRDRGPLHRLIRANGDQAGVSRMNLAALHCHLGSFVVDVGALHEAFD